jgi:aminoglycoside phosphotransferase (APT) family kinase protein
MTEIDRALLETIWHEQGLSDPQTIEQPARGSINPCFIVDDAYVIRFTTLTEKGGTHFESERIAYDTLRNSGVPVPQVVALDVSLEIAPYAYLITSKLPGTPIIDSWSSLNNNQRQQVAQEAGHYLAQIHTHSFQRFGKLRSLDFATWYAYVADFFGRYARQAVTLGGITSNDHLRLELVLKRHKSALEAMKTGKLVHSDYHFENILQQDGRITGIIDFEWAYSGDPLADLVVDEKWESMCPGSGLHVYMGYDLKLDANAHIRLKIYKLLAELETLVDALKKGQSSHAREIHAHLFDVVDALM